MQITLEEAIEIHARVLTGRFQGGAADSARLYAQSRKGMQDLEGYAVWQRVADTAERLLEKTKERAPGS